ncbi:hypothetical protein [Kitasatospora sp. NBC_01300]|uniref:hypothetical protein n=1 Tax=Kitasatospora sp. NBC_01300 TaxID=2903574 RepID=UPI002F911AA3|nr:hypothetical protein OG556_40025 [Kitasatospora sp. NBC_01300]
MNDRPSAVPLTRTFTVAELQEAGFPDDLPDGGLVSDEPIGPTKYGQKRRAIFWFGEEDEENNPYPWQLEYEAEVADVWPVEDYGFLFGTAEAVAVEVPDWSAEVIWVPVGSPPR